MSDLGPPPSELRALLDAERDVSATDRAAIRSRLEASVGAAPAAGGVAAGKLIVIGVSVLIVAAGVWWQTRPGRPAAPASAPEATPVERVAPAASVPTEPTTVAAPSEVTAAPITVDVRPAVSKPRTRSAEPSQAQLLAKAWQTLAQREATETLRLLDEDSRLHPTGSLAEERDAIRMKALVAASRRDEAVALARTFLARYPHSPHRTTAQELVKEVP